MDRTQLFQRASNPVALWLFLCCVLVVVMVMVGGATRLTDSGLSMVNWHPIHGIIPPLSPAEWQEEFGHYQQSPEYQKVNMGMGIEEFKSIFWWEYIHRILGRIVGLVFVLPLLWFGVRKKLSPHLGIKLFGIVSLVGVQGLIGWYMVKSGLVDDPHVSPLRLSLHLGLAFIIFGLLWWQWLNQTASAWRQKAKLSTPPFHVTVLLSVIVFLQIIFGAWVAGLDAGLSYNSFPLMDGQFVPEGLLLLDPWYVNMWQNGTMVQFIHRMGAYSIAIAVLGFWWRYRRSTQACDILLWLTIGQITLGILTLLYVVPFTLALLHQLVALGVWTICVFINWQAYGR